MPSTGTTYRGSTRARHRFDCVRFGHCVQTSAQNKPVPRAQALNDDSSPKHLWFSFDSQAHARLASGCRKSCQNYFQTDAFFVFKRPSHLTLCMKSQLATNKEYMLNRYHNRFFWNHKKQDIVVSYCCWTSLPFGRGSRVKSRGSEKYEITLRIIFSYVYTDSSCFLLTSVYYTYPYNIYLGFGLDSRLRVYMLKEPLSLLYNFLDINICTIWYILFIIVSTFLDFLVSTLSLDTISTLSLDTCLLVTLNLIHAFASLSLTYWFISNDWRSKKGLGNFVFNVMSTNYFNEILRNFATHDFTHTHYSSSSLSSNSKHNTQYYKRFEI